MMTQRELKERLLALDQRIAAAPQWGALLTALDEERRGILAALRNDQQLTPAKPHGVPSQYEDDPIE